jgi:transposase
MYSGLMIHAELGEIDRFDRMAEAVSYAGLDPVVREFGGETRREAGISKQGNGCLRWILYQCASSAVHNAKDAYLGEFYWRLRNDRGKSHQEGMVATSRKLLVSLLHMMRNEEVYNPAGAA